MVWIFILPVVAQAQLEIRADSVIPFQPPVKTWYVQTLEEIADELFIKKSSDPGIVTITYSEKSPAVSDHFLVAEKQKYSWKLSEIDLGYRSGIDSVYLVPFGQKQILHINWSHYDGVSTSEFGWNEVTKGLVMFDLSTGLILLDEVIYKEENHAGSSVDENYLKGETGFNDIGMYVVDSKEYKGTQIMQIKDTRLEGENLQMTLKSLDPHDKMKVVHQWPEAIYRYTPNGWRKVN